MKITAPLITATQIAALMLVPLMVGAQPGAGATNHTGRTNGPPPLRVAVSQQSRRQETAKRTPRTNLAMSGLTVSPNLYKAVTGLEYPKENLSTGAKSSPVHAKVTHTTVKQPASAGYVSWLLSGLPSSVTGLYHRGASIFNDLSGISEAYLVTCNTTCPTEFYSVKHYYEHDCGEESNYQAQVCVSQYAAPPMVGQIVINNGAFTMIQGILVRIPSDR